jgi:hypothetical protein
MWLFQPMRICIFYTNMILMPTAWAAPVLSITMAVLLNTAQTGEQPGMMPGRCS